jgi:PAS domain S-box-containing protein
MQKEWKSMMPLSPNHDNSKEKNVLVPPKKGAKEVTMHKAQDVSLQIYTHLMVEHLPAGIALFDAQELCLLAANSSYHALHQPAWQQGRALGQPLTALLTAVLPGTEAADIIEHFRAVVRTRTSFHAEAYQVIGPTRGVTYWNWTIEPIFEQDQVRYVLVTVTDVTASVTEHRQTKQAYTALTQVHRRLERERQRLAYEEAILASLQRGMQPKELAQSVLTALHTCFSPSLLAFYSIQIEQEACSLLAWLYAPGKYQEAPLFLSLGHPQFDDLPLLLARDQQRPLVKRKSQGEEDFILAHSNDACVVYLPLWGTCCEGMLALTFAKEEEATDLLMRTLSECAPSISEALASAKLHAVVSEERQRLYAVLDQLPEGVLVVEARTSTISYANPAAAHLLGRDLSQLVNVPLNQAAMFAPFSFASQDQPSAFSWNFALIHALSGKTSTNQELLVSRPNGSEIVVLSSTAPIRGTNGLISEAVIVFQDITALKRLEQARNEFFAVANHELRTPLTIIAGFAELLQQHDTAETKELYHYALTSMAQECEQLTHLLNSFLDVSRLELVHLDMKRRFYDLLSLLKQSVTKYAHTTSTHQVHLRQEDLQPGERLVGWFDVVRIEQVLNNLLSNAIKYSPAGGAIEVGVRPRRDDTGSAQEALIWVKDQGIGIPPSDLPHIFERFYRAKAGDASISGFGIGLYLTKEIVQGHEGRIWVESEQDQGSTFFVALPLGEQGASPL